MKKDPKTSNRKSNRLQGYDYSQPGAYFITICTYQMNNLFGRINAGEMKLNIIGRIAKIEWQLIDEQFPYIELYDNELIIMPNHIHVIIWITDVGATETVARKSHSGPKPDSLSAIVGQYKSRTTKLINQNRNTPGKKVWQRNYYDRIIRNDQELQAIRRYIENNPLQWEEDRGKSLDGLF